MNYIRLGRILRSRWLKGFFIVGFIAACTIGHSIYRNRYDRFPIDRLPEWGIFKSHRVDRTQNDIADIESAITAFRSHYGKLPFTSPERELQFSTTLGHELNGVAATFNRINPEGVKFLNVRAGQQYDGWGRRYTIVFDRDGDGIVSPGGIPLRNEIGIWSNGPNGIDERGGGDDLRNW